MKSRLLAFVIQCIALPICCLAPGVTLAQANSSAAEFGELVRSLLVPTSATPDPPSWGLGAHPAVRWKSPIPQPAEASLVKDGLPMSRTGVVQITGGGQPTHRSSTNQPGQWNLILAGSRASPLEARLAMDRQADAGLDPSAALKAAGFKIEALCEPGGISSGTTLYAVEAAGYRPVLLAHEWSSGSAGTWMQLTVAYTKQSAARLKCE